MSEKMKRLIFYLGKGSCTPKERNPHSDSIFKMKWSFFPAIDASTTKKIVAMPPPPATATGTKDETFFDSQPWLESDNEDFYSIQGESCPSLKGSPLHQKKSLSDLFCESFDRTRDIDPGMFSDKSLKEGSPDVDPRKPSCGFAARHCFPGLVRSLSCREWRKKRLSNVQVP